MSKILWRVLELSPALLCVSFLVANSTLAAQEQKSSATTDQSIDSLLSLSKSIQEEQVKRGTKYLNASTMQVVVNSTVTHQQPLSDTKSRKLSLMSVVGNNMSAKQQVNPTSVASDKTLANKTSDSTKENTSVSPKLEAQKTTDELIPSDGEQTNPDSNADSSDPMDQVSNVSQFSDVRPGDWAYESLRELVERYGCIAGYPDSTYRGNRAMTRYEFAAGLRACLNQIEKLIAASTTNFATKEDLEKLRRLTEEFQSELAALGTRVDKLESRASFLENHQFSPTTKLNSAIIFGVAETFGNKVAVPSGTPIGGGKLSSNAIFSDRVRLNFDTSFTGRDRLRTRIEANNTTPLSGNITGTNETRLGYDNITGGVRGNGVVLGKLNYRFPLTNSTTLFLDAIGGEFYDNISTFNPFLESADIGSISRFGRFNPIYRTSNTGSGSNNGAGATIIQRFGNAFSISAGYLARNAQDPIPSRGLFDGTYAAIGQVAFQPLKQLGLALTYSHAYYAGSSLNSGDVSVTGGTGSVNANLPFNNTPTSKNSYGLEASFPLSHYFSIAGWAGLDYSTAEKSNPNNTVVKGQHATSYNYAVTLAFPDFGRRGNLLSIIFGQPPRTTRDDARIGNGGAARRRDSDSSYPLEGLYRIQLFDNLSVTPGTFVILNPENNSKNPTQYVGVFRATFTF